MQRLERAEKMMLRSLRWMCGVTLKNRKSSEKLIQSLGIVSVYDRVHQEKLRWFGHTEWKDKSDWVSACRNISVSGQRGWGRVEKLGCSA